MCGYGLSLHQLRNKLIHDTMSTQTQNLAKLKEMDKTFFAETKAQFKSCTDAQINVDDFALYNIWGDFKSRKDAVGAIRMWGIAFGRKVDAKVVNARYRVSIEF